MGSVRGVRPAGSRRPSPFSSVCRVARSESAVAAAVALVRAVGQVEILMTLLFSRFYLKESPTRAEVLGALTVVVGVVLVLAGR